MAESDPTQTTQQATAERAVNPNARGLSRLGRRALVMAGVAAVGVAGSAFGINAVNSQGGGEAVHTTDTAPATAELPTEAAPAELPANPEDMVVTVTPAASESQPTTSTTLEPRPYPSVDDSHRDDPEVTPRPYGSVDDSNRDSAEPAPTTTTTQYEQVDDSGRG